MAGGVVAAVALGLFFGRGSIIVLSFGVFLKDLIKDFHTTRAAISFAFTLHNILGALSTPVVGRLIDAAEERKVILTGTAIFGLSYFPLGSCLRASGTCSCLTFRLA